MVNNCHAKRDTKTCSGVAGHFILGYFGISTRLCPLGSLLPIICHCPAHIIIGRAIQWNMPSGVAGLLCGEAVLFDARMTAMRKCLLLTNVCARPGGFAASGFPPAGENDGREGGAKTPLERNKTGNESDNTYARIARRCVV
ncbi:hypothetical protein [Candidatus Spongiihabitans sp.]|uniref:hypothetical protein n=1 Tax=Candidatus Spongiihabitans sp. TaxID=3101308 RepID=UPI003C7ED10F